MEAEITIQGSILYTEDGLAEFTYFTPSIWQTIFCAFHSSFIMY